MTPINAKKITSRLSNLSNCLFPHYNTTTSLPPDPSHPIQQKCSNACRKNPHLIKLIDFHQKTKPDDDFIQTHDNFSNKQASFQNLEVGCETTDCVKTHKFEGFDAVSGPLSKSNFPRGLLDLDDNFLFKNIVDKPVFDEGNILFYFLDVFYFMLVS